MCIFLFLSADIIFRTLIKNIFKIKIEKEANNLKILNQKLSITFFLQMIFLHKLHLHVHYKEVY